MEKEGEGKESKNEGKDGIDDESKPRRKPRERRTEDVDEKAPEEAATDPSAPKGRRRRAAADNQDKNKEPSGGGGWMSSPDKKDRASKLTIEEDDAREPTANPMNKDKFFQENSDDIMIIPDLDEDGFDGDQRVAHAPRNVTRRIPTLADLESEVKAAIPSAEGGLDLGVLLRTLVPAALVQESDVVWTFESLLRDVTDELAAPTKTVIEPSAAPVDPSTPPAKDPSAKTKSKASVPDKKDKVK